MMTESSFEEILSRDGRLVYSSVGDSMLPLIRQGRDLVVIKKAEGRLKKYDIPLYKRPNGRYVLHRVLRVHKDSYDICGDNRRHIERGVTDRQILGVLTAVVRDGREIPLKGWKYRLYILFWCAPFPIRAGILMIRDYLRRIKRDL